MGKAVTFVVAYSLFLIGLFIGLVFLMSTVNPEPLPSANSMDAFEIDEPVYYTEQNLSTYRRSGSESLRRVVLIKNYRPSISKERDDGYAYGMEKLDESEMKTLVTEIVYVTELTYPPGYDGDITIVKPPDIPSMRQYNSYIRLIEPEDQNNVTAKNQTEDNYIHKNETNNTSKDTKHNTTADTTILETDTNKTVKGKRRSLTQLNDTSNGVVLQFSDEYPMIEIKMGDKTVYYGNSSTFSNVNGKSNFTNNKNVSKSIVIRVLSNNTLVLNSVDDDNDTIAKNDTRAALTLGTDNLNQTNEMNNNNILKDANYTALPLI